MPPSLPNRRATEENALDGPPQGHQRDQGGASETDMAIPGFTGKPVQHQPQPTDNRKLAQFHADIEAEQRCQEISFRQTELAQHAGKPKAVEQTEQKDHCRAPARHVLEHHVLDGDEGDR